MPIKWKKRFNPALVIDQINSIRTINSEGKPAFSGFEIEHLLPTLESMLDFPSAAYEVDNSTLVWMGLASVTSDLTSESFIKSINNELKKRHATKEIEYFVLSEISIDYRDIPRRISILDRTLRFYPNKFPNKFKSRQESLSENPLSVPPTPQTYCKVSIQVKAKSPKVAVNKALEALDLQRALWCLIKNPAIQLTFGAPSLAPINAVRLGSRHTLHYADGSVHKDLTWYEPGFVKADVARIDDSKGVKNFTKNAVRSISNCAYGENIAASMIRFVRALDESDANTAFLGTWGALESLTSPDVSNYDKIVQRCSFLFEAPLFHRQLLEHLREYRNSFVHTGKYSDKARIHCFQIQMFYRTLIFFHIANANFFNTLEEANYYLDSPVEPSQLNRRAQLIRKAYAFRSKATE